MGTGALTFTLPLPASHDATAVATPLQAVVWAMLGVLPFQHSVETLYAKQQQEAGAAAGLLANACLRAFLVQTGVAVAEKKVNFRLQNMTITVESAARGLRSARDAGVLYTDARTEPFWYMPAYMALSGCDPATGAFSAEALQAAQHALLDTMLEEFWRLVQEANYFPAPDVHQAVTEQLEPYLRSAVQRGASPNQSVHFAPHGTSVQLYLHGHAGTGKSAFVAAFRYALERLVQRFFSPAKACVTVKLPLNSLSPQALRGELLVKGISDWSVERMCEQSLTKGHLVLLHLEENPKDPALQEQLYALVNQMLQSLYNRYPAARPNVLQLFTSNYAPAPPIAARCRTMVVCAPAGAEQQSICARMLAELVRAATGADSVRVDLRARPPVATDMRPLDKWKASLCHHIVQALAGHPVQGAELALVVAGQPTALDVSFALPGMQAPQPLVALQSHDAYFFFPALAPSAAAAVVGMVHANALQPGVLVLRGPAAARARHHAALEATLAAAMGAAQIRSTAVTLMSDADKEVVLGSPWDFPRGGLFKFIDDVNNPAGDHRRTGQEYAVIVAHVNTAGQYILRELLEANRSCTHRQMVRKTGVLFVLHLDPDCPVTETLTSRAHVILDLPSQEA